MAQLASLTADASAPTELSSEQQIKLSQHPQVIRLCQKNKALTAKIHAAGYRPISTAKGTPLFEKKKKVQACLNSFKNRLRIDMIKKARKRHFRKADTVAFDSQFSVTEVTQTSLQDVHCAKPIKYHLPERAAVIDLTCPLINGLTEQQKLTRRIRAIKARVALCCRQESRRRRRQTQSHIKQKNLDTSSEDSIENRKDEFPLVCKLKQCIFCLENERKPYEQRVFEYTKANKMMNEVEKHLAKYSPQDQVPCSHPQCKAAALVISNVIAFKAHTAKVHQISLRDPARCGQ